MSCTSSNKGESLSYSENGSNNRQGKGSCQFCSRSTVVDVRDASDWQSLLGSSFSAVQESQGRYLSLWARLFSSGLSNVLNQKPLGICTYICILLLQHIVVGFGIIDRGVVSTSPAIIVSEGLNPLDAIQGE